MKAGAVLLLAVLLSACSVTVDTGVRSNASSARTASPPRTASPTPTPCATGNVTITPALRTGGTMLTGSSPAPAAPLAVMFGGSSVDAKTYVIDLVDATGNIVASTSAHLRSAITGACGNDFQAFPPLPLISTSLGRVYYMDGDRDIRYLLPDGSTGLYATVPGNSQAAAIFAVSPDDNRIAIAFFHYREHPVASELYVEDPGGGNRVNVDLPGVTYPWPLGWHAGKLIVASSGSPNPTFGAYAPLPGGINSLHLVDPASGHVDASLGVSTCRPASSLPTGAGFACSTAALGTGRLDWSGGSVIFATGDAYTGGESLSPDGSTLLASGTGALLKLIASPAAGSTVRALGQSYPQGGGYPGDGGWLDDDHVVYRRAGSSTEYVIDIRTQTDTALPAGTVLAARLPGGF